MIFQSKDKKQFNRFTMELEEEQIIAGSTMQLEKHALELQLMLKKH